MINKKPKKWLGTTPIVCDICKHKVTSPSFVDGKTKVGPWALMCSDCYRSQGTGIGQTYNTTTLEKEEG